MKCDKGILFLTLNCFNEKGGIQRICKTLSRALHDIAPDNLTVLSLYDDETNTDYLPKKNFRGFSGAVFLFSLTAYFASKECAVIVISHIHLIPVLRLLKHNSGRARLIMLAHGTELWRPMSSYRRKFIATNIEIWAVSDFTARTLITQHKLTRVKVLHNCLDPYFNPPANFHSQNKLRAKYNLRTAAPIVLTLCRITRHEFSKGYDKILDVLPQLLSDYPNLHYLLCGPLAMDERGRLKRKIKDMGLQSHVTITGQIREEDLAELYATADVFAMPSLKEGFGLVFIEAAACGCKVISGNRDGSREAMLEGLLGDMIDPEDQQMLKKTLSRNLGTPLSVAQKLNQQKLAYEHFGYQTYIRKLKKLLLFDNEQTIYH